MVLQRISIAPPTDRKLPITLVQPVGGAMEVPNHGMHDHRFSSELLVSRFERLRYSGDTDLDGFPRTVSVLLFGPS